MENEFDIEAMVQRFQARAAAVKKEISRLLAVKSDNFIEQAQQDYMDYAIIGDAKGSLVDGVLTLKIDLRG